MVNSLTVTVFRNSYLLLQGKKANVQNLCRLCNSNSYDETVDVSDAHLWLHAKLQASLHSFPLPDKILFMYLVHFSEVSLV